MGLFDALISVYDVLSAQDTSDARLQEPLLPLSHGFSSADLEITLGDDGTFFDVKEVTNSASRLTICPETIDSYSRTSSPTPKPLCDELSFLLPSAGARHQDYMDQLRSWAEDETFSHIKVKAVYAYLKKGSLQQDLERAGLFNKDDKKQLKLFVRWIVLSDKTGTSKCWEDKSLFSSWQGYYRNVQLSTPDAVSVDDMSGLNDVVCAKHPRGLLDAKKSAKLISCNDDKGFTYRGRFTSASQAICVGYGSSQKIHAALRFLLTNYGVYIDSQGTRIVCWNVGAEPVPDFISEKRADGDALEVSLAELYSGDVHALPTVKNYRQALKTSIYGDKMMLNPSDRIAVLAVASATKGRLSVIYYSELQKSQFLSNLYTWYSTLNIGLIAGGQEKVYSPSLFKIVLYAFGQGAGDRLVVDDKVKARYMLSLVGCVTQDRAIPYELFKSIADRAGRAQTTLDGTKAYFCLVTACAVIRKYINDHEKEEVYKLYLDQTNRDRSYLFGRLLAIADSVESRTFEETEKRETNAMRLQEHFSHSPFKTWMLLENLLKPYYASLKIGERKYLRNLISGIFLLFETNDEKELAKPLEPQYLLGFYQQREDFKYRLKTTDNDDDEEDMNE